jgi:uncharacterized cofD-like protein
MQPDKMRGIQGFFRSVRQELRWLAPGIGVKRWLIPLLIGTTLVALGLTMVALDIYRNAPETLQPILSLLSLQELDRGIRVIVFSLVGVGLILYSVIGFNRSLLKPFMRPDKPIVDAVSSYRRKEKGPRVVVIGGGTGLSSLLRGLKEYTHNLTAIVTVADDGGSSGALRRSLGILPPGDIRNCLAALSDDEDLLTQIFQYRFNEAAGVNGHSLGNLFISALADITGSFEQAVAESGRVLAVRGRVMPSTLHDVRLVADLVDPSTQKDIRVRGESNIPTTPGKVKRVWLEPSNPKAYPMAIQAILNAELIVIGPGSLFTSILPNLLVPDIAAAVNASRAYKFFICNVATQPGETDHFDCLDHIQAIEKHLGGRIFDLVICNNRVSDRLPDKVEPVVPNERLSERYSIYCADLLDEVQPWRHDSKKLAGVVMDLFYDRTGPVFQRDEEPLMSERSEVRG